MRAYLGQLGKVVEKLRRLHFKSLGGILALQEEVRRAWQAALDNTPEVLPADEAAGAPAAKEVQS